MNIDGFVPIFEPASTSLKFIILLTNYHQQVEFGLLSEYYNYQKTVSEWFLAKALGMVLKLSQNVCRRFDYVTISISYNKINTKHKHFCKPLSAAFMDWSTDE